jgi:hypothetical protein
VVWCVYLSYCEGEELFSAASAGKYFSISSGLLIATQAAPTVAAVITVSTAKMPSEEEELPLDAVLSTLEFTLLNREPLVLVDRCWLLRAAV